MYDIIWDYNFNKNEKYYYNHKYLFLAHIKSWNFPNSWDKNIVCYTNVDNIRNCLIEINTEIPTYGGVVIIKLEISNL